MSTHTKYGESSDVEQDGRADAVDVAEHAQVVV
jgi:hypothetical protein